jgi:hypothetical protein
MPQFPTKNTPMEHVPATVTRRWLVKAKLQENIEMVLSLPIGPMIQLQYIMAVSGKRHVWNPNTGKPVVLQKKVPRMGADGAQQRDEDGQLIYDMEDCVLDAAEHSKLLDKLTDRVIPQLKAFEMQQLKPNEQDPGDQELSTLTTEELRARLEASEDSTVDQAEDRQGADSP